MSCLPLGIASRPASKSAAHSIGYEVPSMRESSLRVMTTSSSSSSTRSTFITERSTYSARISVVWQLHDFYPILANHLNELDQCTKGDRLSDERIRAQIICAIDVFFSLGSRQDDDRNLSQLWISLDLPERFTPVFLWH